MRKTAFAGLMALSATMVLASAASARTESPAQAPAARHAGLDKDGDGRISQAEFVQARTARLTVLDADRDGAVTAAEVQARMQARRAERATMRFDRLDADKNGQISRAEFDAARPQRAGDARPGRGEWMGERHRGDAHRMARHAGRGMGPNMARGHGPAARTAVREPVAIADVQTRAVATFARLDTDHDGFLTAAEAWSARGDRVGRGHSQVRGQGQGRGAHRGWRMSRPTALATPASPPAPASE